MNKHLEFSCETELANVRRRIITQAERAANAVHSVLSNTSGVHALKAIKFQKIIHDEVFGENLNFIEYLNQTFTYLVCFYAGKELLQQFPGKTVVLNLGTQPGYDVMTTDGFVVCECFAATSAKSNEKLKKDAFRVYSSSTAVDKRVYYYSENTASETAYIKRIEAQHGDITLRNISFDELIAQ